VTDWFEEWFGEEYLALYPHRDDEDADRLGRLIARAAPLKDGDRILDLACGAGRHARGFSERWWTVGLDLSPALLRVARDNDRTAPFVRGDMRSLPFRDGAFALVANLFTSFGYFRDDAQHQRVIVEVARVTRSGGWFVLDYLNSAAVRADLVPEETVRAGEREVILTRALTDGGRFVEKTITLADEGRTFIERVRLFTPDELCNMVIAAGFDVDRIYGDYGGSAWSPTGSRTIVVACRR
jgi:SAM-dependent methyltransferase